MLDLIIKKRDGGQLSAAEIEGMVEAYGAGEIPDYQMAAWLMAVYFTGLSSAETEALTSVMAASGETIQRHGISGLIVDKHSTGGVGDKTTLVLAPLVASLGIPFMKMSGRGLGHTGGTLDKLESIPGFTVDLDSDELCRQVREIGLAVAGQSDALVPADRKLYALRDVTGTVDSPGLIASSIMSKKIAGGADVILLDVKVGSGAFMRNLDEAEELARIMIELGERMERRTAALLTEMNQPLGRAVGNGLEVVEAVETLKGRGPGDLKELVLQIGALQVFLAGKAASPEEGRQRLLEAIDSGRALKKCRQWVRAQGGDPAVVDDPERLDLAPAVELTSGRSGWIHAVDALVVGRVAALLGAGRERKGDAIDHGVGLVLAKKVGDRVEKGETLVRVHHRMAPEDERRSQLLERTLEAFSLADRKPESGDTVHKRLGVG